jgi:hypothetical protein
MSDTYTLPAFGERTTISLGGTALSTAQVISIDTPDHKRKKIATDGMGSTVKTNRKSYKDEQGDIKVKCYYNAAFAATVRTLFDSHTDSACVIKLFDNTDTQIETHTWAKAQVFEYKIDGAEEDKNMTIEVSIMVNDVAVVTTT